MNKYDEIIHLPRPVSKKHPQMPRADRAAQFGAFAALSGYDEAIFETARLTEEEVELCGSDLEEINAKFSLLMKKIAEKPEVEVTYFLPDEKKEGGTYRVFCGRARRVDAAHRKLYFEDQTEIALDAIVSIEGELFEGLEE